MTNEELLKSISDMLKRHEDYLSQNPDVFLGIQDRLLKAIGYDDSEILEKAEDDKKKKGIPVGSPLSATNWKWRGSSKANPEARVSQRELLSGEVAPYGKSKSDKKDKERKESSSTNNPSRSSDKKKSSKSGYTEWKPREDYSPDEQKKIEELMQEGWSHREAERLAGAHQGPKDFMSALEHRVHPSQPSDKMLETMRDIALQYKQRAAKQEGETADPGLNPQKYAAHQHQKAHEQAYADYDKDYKSFLKELDEQDLHPLEYDEAVSQWQKEWHEKNPGAKEKMVESAKAGKAFEEAKQARGEKIQEGAMNIITGGSSSGESSSGEYSSEAAGSENIDPSFQTAAQMIGGQKGESGYEAGTVKDPAAIFREQNPEFAAELKRKLAAKLGKNPEMQERHDAMPHRDRTPQPSPVKRLTPEEIQAQYGDKYKISKPKGEQ